MRKKKLILGLLSLTLIFNLTHTTYATTVSPTEPTETETPAADDTSADVPDSSDNSDTPVSSNDMFPTPPELKAGSAILIDADTGTILYDKNSNTKGYPASITKLMTALLTVENCSLSETVTFTYDAAHSVTWEDAQVPIEEGEQYTVEEALYALLLKSANDVAYGLGEHVGGSIPNFAEMMTARAAEVGTLNTHFANASGLSDPQHYTSAYDIAMIGRACMNNTTIMQIMSSPQYIKSPSNKYNEQRTWNQSHKMLVSGEFYYEYAIGGKTGFTDESMYTLCTFATKDDMNLIAVVLLCPEANDRYTDSIALFNYGFDNFEKITLTSTDTSSLLNDSNYYNSSVFGSDNISFSLSSTAVTVPKGVTADEIEMVINRDAASGDNFATAEFIYGSTKVGSSQLMVSTTIENKTTTTASAKPTNLPFISVEDTKPLIVKSYIIINAWYIIYGFFIFVFLLIILLGLIFMNYSEYGKEVMKTRKRRRGYRRRKLKF